MADGGITDTTAVAARRDRVVRLLQFLQDLVRSRVNMVRDVSDHVAWVSLAELGVKADVEVRPGGTVLTVTSKDGGAVDSAYAKLLRLSDELSDHPESVELVIASGLLSARSGDVAVRAHLFTQAATIERDRKGRKLAVSLPRDSSPRLEDTLLVAGLEGFSLGGSSSLQTELRASVNSAIDPRVESFGRQWLNAHSFLPGTTVEHEPALVLRTRGSGPLLTFYDAMIAHVSDHTNPVPPGLAQLVESLDSDERVAMLTEAGALLPRELVDGALYPLPSNVEQRDILSQLGADSGVVVEGPPGTGKTHTIANLISALLAKNQRVLVVSERAQALNVLTDKLPQQLQHLVVAVTDVGEDGSASLAGSINEIATRKSTYSQGLAESELENVRAKRDGAIARREEAMRQLWGIRESETEVHEYVAPGYSGTAAQVVRETIKNAGRYEWLPGPVDGILPPLTRKESERLLSLLRSNTELRSKRLAHNLPDLAESLPGWRAVEETCRRLADSPLHDEGLTDHSLPRVLDGVDLTRLEHIRARCERIDQVSTTVARYRAALKNKADDWLAGNDQHLLERLDTIDQVLDEARAQDKSLAGTEVSFAGPADSASAKAYLAYATHLTDGGQSRQRFFKSSAQKRVEAVDKPATVNGEPAVTPDAVQSVATHVQVESTIARVRGAMADFGIDDPEWNDSASRSARLSRVRDQVGQLRTIKLLVAERDGLVQQLQRISPLGPRPKSLAELDNVVSEATLIAGATDGQAAQRDLIAMRATAKEIVEQGPSPEGDQLIAALSTYDYPQIRDAGRAWNVARDERDQQGAMDLLALRLRAKSPVLMDLLASTFAAPEWDQRLRTLDDAWAWRSAMSWVAARVDPEQEVELNQDLGVAEDDLAHFTAQLAGSLGWQKCLQRMTVEEVQALHSYRDHISNVGRGSGKHAERYRVAARAAMREAQSAVPGWIMPISQVLATVPPEPNSFDVVIVDEASQADITSVFLLWLAPRVIVVGDENQCAPTTFTGSNLDDVFERLDTQLSDIPQYLRDNLTPRSSLFTLLRTRFGRIVRLREHFRCMPEIIDFSSRQFYRDAPLIPLRHFGSDRLTPLKTTFVDGGEVSGHGQNIRNIAEATAIVDQVVKVLADQQYDGATCGVIVLQGQGQVDEIYRRLRAMVDPDEWDARRLRVGTPPDFQGDERDVIFLSMVVVPDYRFVSLTGRDFQRRFNVAASRARNQMWLFHSLPLSALKNNDLRASMLRYVATTSSGGAQLGPGFRGEVPTDRRVEPFESIFEQRVFRRLVDEGYRVEPKVPVNNVVIDLVVTGADGRLAISCDGDEFRSTAAQARSDMERERELRRCGWEFVRVRESEYLADEESVVAAVVSVLARRGVAPLAARPAEPIEKPSKGGRGKVDTWEPIKLDIDTD